MRKVYVLVKLGIENRQYIEAVTEDEKFAEAWRRRGARFVAIKRTVIEDREGWWMVTEPKSYALWKAWHSEK